MGWLGDWAWALPGEAMGSSFGAVSPALKSKIKAMFGPRVGRTARAGRMGRAFTLLLKVQVSAGTHVPRALGWDENPS